MLVSVVASIFVKEYGCSKNSSDQRKAAAPRGDYVYSRDSSRVKDLVGLFETMSNFEKSTYSDKNNVIITLSESMDKLRTLSAGYPLETRCNKYVKLISRPNIRTFAAVNLLMNENKLFNEIDQSDVNTVSRVENERSFDALARIQTLVQTLESEKTNLQSNYKPDMQKELLDCINYYIYRHQRATLGLTQYVRESLESVAPQIAEPSVKQFVLSKFEESITAVHHIEQEGLDKNKNILIWLSELTKLQNLITKNGFEIPKLVRDLLNDNGRLKRLRNLEQVSDRARTVWTSCVKYEMLRNIPEKEYQAGLVELSNLVNSYSLFDGSSLAKFIKDPKRQKLVRGFSLENQLDAPKVKVTQPKTTAVLLDFSVDLRECDLKYEDLKQHRIFSVDRSEVSQSEISALAKKVLDFHAECLSENINGKKNRWSTKHLTRNLYGSLNKARKVDNLTDEEKKVLIGAMNTLRQFKI